MLRDLPFRAKIMIALALTVVVAVGAVGVLARRAAERHFSEYVSVGQRARAEALAQELASYYATNGSWQGVEQVLAETTPTAMPGMHGRGMGRGAGTMMMGAQAPLILTDADGRVVADPDQLVPGDRLSQATLDKGTAIVVDGYTVGYLISASGPQEEVFRQRLDRSLLGAGVLAGVVAILLGVLLTRTVVRPLRVLRDATQRIAQGDLSTRAPVEAKDEIGDLARNLNEMAAALERDEELRRKLMADVAHELRSPLAVMQAQVEALQDGVFDLSVENLAPIHHQTTLLRRLVDDLRDLALAEAGQLPMEMGEVQPGELLRRIVVAFQSRAQAQGVALRAEVSGELPLVRADAQRLEQVLGNLLSNAVRHTPRGGVITVRGWAEGDEVLLAVEDSGSGIAPEDLPHIFDRFYRADPARQRSEGSTGLGLSIAQEIVAAHGGAIRVASELGRGTTFTVALPRLEPLTATL